MAVFDKSRIQVLTLKIKCAIKWVCLAEAGLVMITDQIHEAIFMPYTIDDPDLPENVKSLPADKRRQWVHVWNSSFDGCIEDGGESDECEAIAFRNANGVVNDQEEGALSITTLDVLTPIEQIELSLVEGRSFDGMIADTFYDMLGRKVTIEKSDLAKYVENTSKAIEATREESTGEVVGLPIDANNHENGDGAGWIVGVELGSNNFGEVVRITPRWTEIGLELLKKGIRRFFSPTVDIAQKIILGGSLTNWPASRNTAGVIMLRPIELGDGRIMYAISEDNQERKNDMTDQTVLEPVSQTSQGVQFTSGNTSGAVITTLPLLEQQPQAQQQLPPIDLAALLQMGKTADEIADEFRNAMLAQYQAMQARAAQEAAELVANIRKEATISDLATKIIGGTSDRPVGLPLKINELKAFLLSLDASQLQYAVSMLSSIWQSGLVEYGEIGQAKGGKTLLQLPAELVEKLNSGEIVLADLSNPVITDWVGSLDQYDLSAWKK